jgi:hypothetical protein
MCIYFTLLSTGPKDLNYVPTNVFFFTTFSVQGKNKNSFNRNRIPLYLVELSVHDNSFQVKTKLLKH